MSEPRRVSRKALGEFDGVRWNAYVDFLAMSELDELTPIQRRAYLAFWYANEVENGGHDQYFGNKAHFDQDEVAKALIDLGADCQADVLRRAAKLHDDREAEDAPDEKLDEYLRRLSELDAELYECRPRLLNQVLERYLDRHEAEFIEWVPLALPGLGTFGLPGRREARAVTALLLESSIEAQQEGRDGDVGKGFDEMWDLLTEGRWSELIEAMRRTSGWRRLFRSFKLQRELSQEARRIRSSYPLVGEALNFVGNWIDSRNHDWSEDCLEKDEWIAGAREYIEKLRADADTVADAGDR